MTKLVKMASKVELFDGRSPNEIAWAKRLPPEALNKARMLHAVSLDTIARLQAQSDERTRLSDSIRTVKRQIEEIDRYAQHGGKLASDDIKERAELVAEWEELQQKAKEPVESIPSPVGVDQFWQLYENDPRATYQRKVMDYKGGAIRPALESALPTVRGKIEAKIETKGRVLGADLTLEEQLAALKAGLEQRGRNSKFKHERVKRFQRTHNGYAQAKPDWNLGRQTSADISGADVMAFICGNSSIRAMLLKEWEAELRASHDPKTALSIEQRTEKAAQLSAETLDLERLEESIVMASLRAGIAVERRPGTNILAVLEIEVDHNAKRVSQEFGGSLMRKQSGDPEESDFDFDTVD
ncbi:MAG: hypothetical protein CFE29_14085 [Bradyrhizobiaceae bacterium PARB1]|jgi:hypothetical protein|nr:MAG: hypothetical protein CFE29_14085 [Bradyrhizobiaceae bacterium PARB1]